MTEVLEVEGTTSAMAVEAPRDAGEGQPRQAQDLWYATEAQVRDSSRRLVEVTIIRPGESKNGFFYPEEVLVESLPRWEGVAAFADHSREKSIRNLVGVYTSPRWEGAIKANLRFIDDQVFHLVEQVVRDQAQGLAVPDIGISADLMVQGVEGEDGSYHVSRILDILSADIVFQPAAGGTLDRVLESQGGNRAQIGVVDELPQEEQGQAGSGAAESALPADGQEEPLVPFKRVRDLQSQGDRLRHQLAQREEEVQRLRNSLQEAAMKYRQALLAAHPVIPEQLLSGSTIEELEASLERARMAVEKVRERLEEDMARSQAVPAGAPVRRGPDLSALSPREKILYGLSRK